MKCIRYILPMSSEFHHWPVKGRKKNKKEKVHDLLVVATCVHVAMFPIESFKDMSILKTENYSGKDFPSGRKITWNIWLKNIWRFFLLIGLLLTVMGSGRMDNKGQASSGSNTVNRRLTGYIQHYWPYEMERLSFDDLEGFSEVLRNQVHLLQEKL